MKVPFVRDTRRRTRLPLPRDPGYRLVWTVVLLSLLTACVALALDLAIFAAWRDTRGAIPAALASTALSALFSIVVAISLGVLLTGFVRRPMGRLVEESLGIVVSGSREATIVLQDGRIVVANPAASAALGLPRQTLRSRTLAQALSGTTITSETGDVVDPAALLDRALERATTVQLSRAGQAPRWYVFQAVRHGDDFRDRVLVTARDVTEERRLQQVRSEIVSLISHDLRSPLAVVVGYLDLLRKPLTDAERDKAIASARRNAGRMADLLEDLLSAARAEELLAPAALLPIPLAELAGEVVSSLAPMHPERELALETSCQPTVLGEEKRLRQALVNLVTNAFKYAPEDRAILVRVECVDPFARLMVIDHGPGVPEKDRDRVFDRYARLEGNSGHPGVGLGLYIVRIIAENHGGGVRCEETAGGGATFVIELPCVDPKAAGEQPPVEAPD